jgi:Ca2+-binding EF-hand superfamily protein
MDKKLSNYDFYKLIDEDGDGFITINEFYKGID